MSDEWGWVDEKEEEIKEERAKGYFDIKEGSQQFVLLSHCAPLAQIYEAGKYRAATEGERGASIKGVCWVLQDGLIKQAKLPYTLVKDIRALQQNPDWEFKVPFPHVFTLSAIKAGTKDVKYSLTASPKIYEIPPSVMTELAKKPSPESIVERIKGGKSPSRAESEDMRDAPPTEYPDGGDINPDDIPF